MIEITLRYNQIMSHLIVLLLPLIFLMPYLVSNPVMGVYLAEPVADFLAVLFTAFLFRSQFKKAIASMG